MTTLLKIYTKEGDLRQIRKGRVKVENWMGFFEAEYVKES
jgi:hypothetical protein